MTDRPDRPTKELPIAVGETLREIRAAVREIERAARSVGHGYLVDRLVAVGKALEPPRFEGLLEGMGQPGTWPTVSRVQWMGERLAIGADVILRLREVVCELGQDAEIVGSTAAMSRADTAVKQAEDWLASLGLLADERPDGE
jgi:hypothetical protein